MPGEPSSGLTHKATRLSPSSGTRSSTSAPPCPDRGGRAAEKRLVPARGLEPRTIGLKDRCSNQAELRRLKRKARLSIGRDQVSQVALGRFRVTCVAPVLRKPGVSVRRETHVLPRNGRNPPPAELELWLAFPRCARRPGSSWSSSQSSPATRTATQHPRPSLWPLTRP